MSGYASCPSCQFLVGADDLECRFCKSPLQRAAAPVPYGTVGFAPPPPPPPPPAPVPAGRSLVRGIPQRALRRVVAGVTASGLVAIGAALFGGSDESPYPDAWDPRIESLVAYVEQERGLPFEHPVHVEFLDEAEFDRTMTEGPDPTDDLRAQADKYAGMYRAFGLVSGELDLFASGDGLMTSGVAALYSYDTKRIYISGTELNASTEVTLVHELVHAWQDQHLDFLAIDPTLDAVTQETQLAAIEGDATRIEYRYYFEALTDAERAEVDAVESSAEVAEELTQFPRVLVAEFAAPYVLGHPYVNLLAAWRGDTAVDEAITTPMASTEAILDPFALLDVDMPVPVAEPALVEGEERFDGGTLGALDLYLILNERIGPKDALAAADGWAGDSYVAFTRDGRTCVRVHLQAESADATQRIASGIGVWAAAMPPGAVTWNVGEIIELTSCDPGPEATIPPPVLPDVDPLLVPAARLEIVSGGLQETGDAEFVRCFTSRFMDAVAVEQLVAMSDDLAPLSASVAEGCIVGG